MNELKVLLIEDSEKDAALILRELRKAGYSPVHQRVETAGEMTAALEAENWDVILCDHAMPEFNGMEALRLLRRRDPDMPFIIVSGQIGEDLAVAAMKAGANDYIMKSNLKRLVPAIEREMRDARERRERRQVEQELRITEEELRFSRQVEAMKDEFIGMVSHELKSPLTVIIGALSVAASEGIPPDEANELVRDALVSAESLNVIIDNLLELSRSQKKRLALRLNPCDVAGVVSTVTKKLETKSEKHRLIKDLPPDLPLIPADSVRIERVLYNLVDNAIKYSPGGGEVRISISPGEYGLVFAVKDQGIGISARDQKKLFRHFERIESPPNKEIEGVGLGLKVCQVLVEAHGGRIWLESAPGTGSTFFFTLPGGAGAPA
jgi:signal transduction histidine kinase